MVFKIGEFDVQQQLLNNEFRIGVLEKFIDRIVFMNTLSLKTPTQKEIENIRKEVAQELKVKYPNSGIELKSK